ncbi:UDP-galactopyranose mutase [Spirochaetia bacterium]|nr:UDP-galactopyranose mutase [Spirochaetia bacterium]
MRDIAEKDCIIIGSGFCGSVIARKLAEQRKKILLLERRKHIAGNMYDEVDANGILVQRYGPHSFHTNNHNVFEFITKYGKWVDYSLKCAVDMDGVESPSPFNFETIDLLYDKAEAEVLKSRLETYYLAQKTVTILELLGCDDGLIKSYAKKLFEMDYRPYTAKQWGIQPEEIDPSVLKRVPVRLDYTNAYFDDTYQCLPKNGYTHFFENLLDHEKIQVVLETDALDLLKVDADKEQVFFEDEQTNIPVIYTGAIDELFGYKYGRLPYRSLRFDYQTKKVDAFQSAPVVAYPKAEGYTRITEYKKLPPQDVPGVTTVAYEYPIQAASFGEESTTSQAAGYVPLRRQSDVEPYYPILTDDNIKAYEQYKHDAKKIPNLFLCGRLADYKYYNMDAAIMRAFEVYGILVR